MSDSIAGRKPVLELLQRSPERVEAVFVQKGARWDKGGHILDACRASGVRFRLCQKQELDKLFDGNHQGVVAQIMSRGFVELEDLLDLALQSPVPLVTALDQVQDPGNVGALARTLYALGAGGMMLPKHGAARLGTGAYKASAGALDMLPLSRVTNLSRALETCIEKGFFVYGAALGPSSLNAFSAPLTLPAVLVLGNEEKGLRPGVAKRCDELVHIPMGRDFDSLNVAQAGAILAAQFVRSTGK
ncbi:MAG: 23S rRNA (guanosine(2251)-2'-O)-methyltransferase RlmB [Desulfovibrio sp.]|uniref:23S rRNA (guanosine(2251)-2'-O)-methyltransferase RlmB n=1 Tax=Desulfovibrio sp. 7SRBS1 TaxID=3378064 RepID=UPI003B3EC40D